MNRKSAFTLIELLVALTIFTMVVSASYALFEGGRTLAARGEYHARRFQAARTSLRALEADLRHSFMGGPYDGGFKSTAGGTEELPIGTIEAIGFNNQPRLSAVPSKTVTVQTPPEFDMARVTYSIDEDEGTKATGLVRRRVKLVPEIVTVEDPEEGLEEISADVVGLKFRFYDGTDWLETWDSTVSRSLPKIVEATVYVKSVFREKEEIEAFSTRFTLPAGGGASQ